MEKELEALQSKHKAPPNSHSALDAESILQGYSSIIALTQSSTQDLVLST